MKGGSKSAPAAPDLSGNIGTANGLSSTATNQANQTFNTAQTVNANSQANLSNVTGAQTPVMNKVADTTNQNLSTYGSTFVPLQQQQAQQAAQYGSAANVSKLQGMAGADANSANQAALANSRAALASEGVDPASVHGAALDAQSAVTGAANVAGAENQSAVNTTNTAIGLTQQANQLGLGVDAAGNSGATTGAGVGSALTGDVNSTNATDIGNLTADSSLLNTGVNANSSAVSAANTQYQDQLATYNAQQQALASKGGLLGGALGNFSGMLGGTAGNVLSGAGDLALAAMDKGGAVTGIVPASVEGIDRGVSMAKGGAVSKRGALPYAPMAAHPTDTKPALLTPGEYVIPKDVAMHKGHEFFHKMVDKARVDMASRQAIPHAPSVGV